VWISGREYGGGGGWEGGYTYSSSQPPDPLIGFAGERRGERVSFYSLGNQGIHHYQPPDEIYDIREGGRERESQRGNIYPTPKEKEEEERKKRGELSTRVKEKRAVCVYICMYGCTTTLLFLSLSFSPAIFFSLPRVSFVSRRSLIS
jgi:hypothetical protein